MPLLKLGKSMLLSDAVLIKAHALSILANLSAVTEISLPVLPQAHALSILANLSADTEVSLPILSQRVVLMPFLE
jgi:hypothetical protein